MFAQLTSPSKPAVSKRLQEPGAAAIASIILLTIASLNLEERALGSIVRSCGGHAVLGGDLWLIVAPEPLFHVSKGGPSRLPPPILFCRPVATVLA